MQILRNFINDNKFTPENIPMLREKLFFGGARRRVKLEQFIVLLLLSTLIATYGVIGDSVATVIGAMIIAPLMRPIMATTAALVMGDFRRALSSFMIVVASVTGVILVAWLLSRISLLTVILIENNGQFNSRTSPSLIDLYAALWSGAAGAFAMSREDVADSLPGVAIAIALVPPLCVVGVAMSKGLWSDAVGALLLFTTNFLSILLAGGGVFALLGLSNAAVKGMEQNTRRRVFLGVVIGIALIAIPLGTTTLNAYQQKLITRETGKIAQEWIEGTDYGISRVEVDGDQVTLAIYGSGERPVLSDLGDQLGASLNRPVDINLVVLPSIIESYKARLE